MNDLLVKLSGFQLLLCVIATHGCSGGAAELSAPVIEELLPATRENPVVIRGMGLAGSTVRISGGNLSEATAAVNADGEFEVLVPLRANQRNVLKATLLLGGMASPNTEIEIHHDDLAPSAPQLDPTASPTGGSSARIAGSAEAMASIQVNGGAMPASGGVDESGRFAISVPLNMDAINQLTVTVVDAAGNVSTPTSVVVQQDSSIPAAIVVDAFENPRADASLTLTGSAEPLAVVTVTGGQSTVAPVAGDNGEFTAQVSLHENTTNQLRLTQSESDTETVLVVVHDSIAPSAPMVNMPPSPTSEVDQTITGQSEPLATISIAGGTQPTEGSADDNGLYAVSLTIAADATTMLEVRATDGAGNTSEATTAEVTHSSDIPPAPVLDEQQPAPTNQPTHTVSGEVVEPAAGMEVRISGGAEVVTMPVDQVTGRFEAEVTLNTNQSNVLSVISIEGDIESAAANVTVYHDDVEPSDPVEELISMGEPSLSGCVARTETIFVTGGTGAAEAHSHLTISNITDGSITVSAQAAADGSFTGSIQACVGDVIRFLASDAAGNVSGPTELTVSN